MTTKIPDFTLDMCKAQNYTQFLSETMLDRQRTGKDGSITLSKAERSAFQWILGDIGNLLYEMGEKLYGMEEKNFSD